MNGLLQVPIAALRLFPFVIETASAIHALDYSLLPHCLKPRTKDNPIT